MRRRWWICRFRQVPLTVNPSLNLMLHYFMQRNILGDDPLTDPAIEPSVPAELAVMIENWAMVLQ